MDRPKGYFGEEQIPSRATFLADDNSSFHSNNVFKEQSQAKESDVKTIRSVDLEMIWAICSGSIISLQTSTFSLDRYSQFGR